MALSQNEINNITYDYITRYNLNKERDEKTIKEILINKGNNRFSIFRYICFVKNYLIVSKMENTKSMCQVGQKDSY